MPQYAARLIRAAMEQMGEQCAVIGSRPDVPVEGMESILGDTITWIDANSPVTWRDLGLATPKVYVQSGWAYPAFTALGREVKTAGGHVIGLSDANWRGDFRQLVMGPIAFRMRHRKHFDAMLVPGRQGARLMRHFGVPKDRIHTGMYAADPQLFYPGRPLARRPKEFLFVGQLIARKNILVLANAFLRFAALHSGWSLRICGSGPLRDRIPYHPRLLVEDFVQPGELVDRFQNARFLVLPSRREAWGLVVHEATLCGCGLLLSGTIGSADDLATDRNAIRFRPSDEGDLVRALSLAASRDDAWLLEAECESLRLAAMFSPQKFASAIVTLVEQFQRKDARRP